MEKIKLKGGSLNNTYLIHSDNFSYIRKSVSLVENREYGFQRWYSQLKRLQRYSVLFPKVFPKVLGYSMNNDTAFFDIEYIEGAVNGYEFLSETDDSKKVDNFFESVKKTMGIMHNANNLTMDSDDRSIELYLREEVYQRLKDAKRNSSFNKFLRYDEIEFQGELVPSLINQMDYYKDIAISNYKNSKEVFTHGNLTLENIVYNSSKDEVYFIDPYEENIIDSKLAEYSQLLQSSNSLYELYNSGNAIIKKNKVSMEVFVPIGLKLFNKKLLNFLEENLYENEIKIVKVLEISQFIRMLPFKAVVDENKMIFFYSLASKLLNDLVKL